MGRLNRTFAVTKVSIDSSGTVHTATRSDAVTAEEPLEIRVGGQVLSTTMRTPGHDMELVHGFLHSEGIIRQSSDVGIARYCAGATGADGANTYNVIDVDLAPDVPNLNPASLRLTPTTSACGVCGSSSIDHVMGLISARSRPLELDPHLIVSLPDKLATAQRQFKRTGGIHAAGVFAKDGTLLLAREDIGRHNAADKVIGALLMQGALKKPARAGEPGEFRDPMNDRILVLSSRASFELVHKAAVAGFGALIAVSAPSSLAIELAREAGLTLIAFARPGRFNLYSGTLAHTLEQGEALEG